MVKLNHLDSTLFLTSFQKNSRQVNMRDLFDYLQISYLSILVIIVLIRVLYLLINRKINPFALGKGKEKSKLSRIIEISFSLIIALWSAEILKYSLYPNISVLPSFFHVIILDSAYAKTIGAVLIPIGLFIFAWAQLSFGDSWRVGIDSYKPGELVTKGVFAFSRNPIFVSIDLYMVGTFLMNGTMIFLFAGVFIILNLHYQITHEEKFLAKIYGQKYYDYYSLVGRYITIKRLSDKAS